MIGCLQPCTFVQIVLLSHRHYGDIERFAKPTLNGWQFKSNGYVKCGSKPVRQNASAFERYGKVCIKSNLSGLCEYGRSTGPVLLKHHKCKGPPIK